MPSVRDIVISVMLRLKLYARRTCRNRRRSIPSILYTHNPPSIISSSKSRIASFHLIASQLPTPAPFSSRLVPVFLFLLALAPRLYGISHPSAVVFDEVHFLRFIHAYYHHEYFFDIHPPLGKLTFLAIVHTFCTSPPRQYADIGDDYVDKCFIPLRITSAIFGAFLSPILYLICQHLSLSYSASLLVAFMVIFEHVSIVQSRLILLDAQLITYMALALLCALHMWRATPGKRWSHIFSTAMSATASVTVKWTALVTPFLIFTTSIAILPFAPALQAAEIVFAILIAFSFYTSLFALHFYLLPNSGSGDTFMSLSFQQTLRNNPHYLPSAPRPSFWTSFAQLHWQMFASNRDITTTHRWQSTWWQWIINQRGLLYFVRRNDIHSKLIERVYLIVNPVVSFLCLMAVVLFCCIIICEFYNRAKRARSGSNDLRKRRFLVRGAFLMAGYTLNLLPYLGKLRKSHTRQSTIHAL